MNREQLKPGQQVIWTWTPSHGYCVTQRVLAEVVKVGRVRVKIAITNTRTNQVEHRWVQPENLQDRTITERRLQAVGRTSHS